MYLQCKKSTIFAYFRRIPENSSPHETTRKYLAENSLLEQPFVKNTDQKVGGLLKDADATVSRFVRYEVGEGIEVDKADFAEEVAQLQTH